MFRRTPKTFTAIVDGHPRTWTIGEEIDANTYAQFKDEEGKLHVVQTMEDGKPRYTLFTKAMHQKFKEETYKAGLSPIAGDRFLTVVYETAAGHCQSSFWGQSAAAVLAHLAQKHGIDEKAVVSVTDSNWPLLSSYVTPTPVALD